MPTSLDVLFLRSGVESIAVTQARCSMAVLKNRW